MKAQMYVTPVRERFAWLRGGESHPASKPQGQEADGHRTPRRNSSFFFANIDSRYSSLGQNANGRAPLIE